MTSPRLLDIDADRIDRWLDGFAKRHGAVSTSAVGDRVEVAAADGSTATLQAWLPRPGPAHPNGSLKDWAGSPAVCALILVRRGGYSVGVATPEGVVAHSSGTRYVQGKTKKGGWSQQRYARRRGNQADALVDSVVEKFQGMVAAMPGGGSGHGTGSTRAAPTGVPRGGTAVGGPAVGGPAVGGPAVRDAVFDGLVLGGDRTLCATVLEALPHLEGLPRREFYDLPDPRRAVLDRAWQRARAVRVSLQETEQS